jgi:hypothetical protein
MSCMSVSCHVDVDEILEKYFLQSTDVCTYVLVSVTIRFNISSLQIAYKIDKDPYHTSPGAADF